MIDLHCHLLPGIDDGAPNLAVALSMAKAQARDGVTVVACTPHILPGIYHNSGPQIRAAVAALQQGLHKAHIPLQLVCGADNHIRPDFIAALRNGHLLSLADSRYVLVEPPHHIAPPRLEELFFDLLTAGFVPVLTHPERLGWIKAHYAIITRLALSGVWMQVTAGSLTGAFGKNAQYWAERMLGEGKVHLLATDAHDIERRPPNLQAGRQRAADLLGALEAEHLVVTRPIGVLQNTAPASLPAPLGLIATHIVDGDNSIHGTSARVQAPRGSVAQRGFSARLRSLFD